MKVSGKILEKIHDKKEGNGSSRIRKGDFSKPSASLVDRVMYLQRTIGNLGVERMIRAGTLQAALRIGQPGDEYEKEADRVADEVMRMPEPQIVSGFNHKFDPGIENQIQSIRGGGSPLSEEERTFDYIPQVFNNIGSVFKRKLIQRVPAPGGDFGTFRYCGFGITTRVPGFIKDNFKGSFDVDYTTGCSSIRNNSWSSVWELYDSANRKMDTNTEIPYGGYSIEGDKINAGTPGDGGPKWSLWYRITRNQPWSTDDSDAYPYDYITFDVYSLPIRNQNTRLREELGPIIWQDNFTPAEDGASLEYNFSATASRTTTDSQTTTVSGTVGGERSSNLGFEFEGLTGGFASRLSYSATASLSRTHSVSVQTSKTLSNRFSQPNLRAGVTYKVIARPIYHIIDGSVDMINERDGVISGSGQTLSGGIRIIKGLDIRIETEEKAEALVKRRCWSQRNCTGKAYNQKFSHCHNCYNYASGKSLGEPGNCENC